MLRDEGYQNTYSALRIWGRQELERVAFSRGPGTNVVAHGHPDTTERDRVIIASK